MFRESTSRADAVPTPNARESFWMLSASRSRRRSVIFFESSSPTKLRGSVSEENATAAATTGPAHGPRPASSIPTIVFPSAASASKANNAHFGWVSNSMGRNVSES